MKLLQEGLKKQAILGLIYKLSTIITGYLAVPFLLVYLGKDQYGLWITITSIFGWFTILDMGIGNGLQNQLIKSFSDNDKRLSQQLISTAYFSLAVIIFLIFSAGLLLIYFIPSGLIDTLVFQPDEIRPVYIIMLTSVCIILFLNIYINLYNSLKKTSTALLTKMISRIIMLAGIIILSRTGSDNRLFNLAITQNALDITVIIASTIFFFLTYPYLKPSLKFFNPKLIKQIATIGFQFFIIHLSWVIINSTDNLIISNQLGSGEVTAFSLVFKVISLGKIVFFLLLTPFWPQFSEYFYKKKTSEMKRLLYRYIKILILVNTVLIAGSFLVPKLINLWTAQQILISVKLIVFTVIFVIMDNIVGLFTYCLNAISHVKLQMYLYILGGILNIPLSLILVNTSLGTSGVILASCICYIPLTVIMPFQVILEIKRIK